MMLPPSWIWIAIKSDRSKGFKLWLPLFLLIWPLMLVAGGLFLLIWLIALFGLIWTKQGRQLLRIPFILYELICSFRGLIVEVNDEDRVQIIIN